MASAGTPEQGPNRWRTWANRIVVCLRLALIPCAWKQHSGELVTPYDHQMLHDSRTPIFRYHIVQGKPNDPENASRSHCVSPSH